MTNMPVMVRDFVVRLERDGHRVDPASKDGVWTLKVTSGLFVEGNHLRFDFPRRGKPPRIYLLVGEERRECSDMLGALLSAMGQKPIKRHEYTRATSVRVVSGGTAKYTPGAR